MVATGYFSRVESLYRLQQATVKHSSAILAYAPDARNWTGIGRSPDGGNCGRRIYRGCKKRISILDARC